MTGVSAPFTPRPHTHFDITVVDPKQAIALKVCLRMELKVPVSASGVFADNNLSHLSDLNSRITSLETRLTYQNYFLFSLIPFSITNTN